MPHWLAADTAVRPAIPARRNPLRRASACRRRRFSVVGAFVGRRWPAGGDTVDDMSERVVLEPGPEHPITVAPNHGRVRVRVGGEVVADTRAALRLDESGYPPVYYVPRKDVIEVVLTSTETRTYCPFKGEAAYYSVTPTTGEAVDDAVWSYEQPYPAVAAIAGHVAFYPGKADIEVE